MFKYRNFLRASSRCGRPCRWVTSSSTDTPRSPPPPTALPVSVDDLLIYSTEIDVFDSTHRRNPRKFVQQHELKMKKAAEREHAAMLQTDERTNFSMALPHVFGEHVRVQMGDEVMPDEVFTGDLEEESTSPAVYPFGLFRHPSVHQSQKRIEDDGLGRRVRRRRGKAGDHSGAKGDDAESEGGLARDDLFRYGTADPDIPPSKIPCGGCGAHLHCQDAKMPGFTPVEAFAGKGPDELRLMVCQRCYIMEKYNVALKVNVSPGHYESTIAHIASKRAIVLLVVDLLDYPGSVWPGIVDLLGVNKKIILVGNKVDMLPQDSENYLVRVERVMKMAFMEKCSRRPEARCDPKVVSTCLVSARTGYGIEKLITLVYRAWSENNRGLPPTDVYLVGTTNVGKSSIFNQLLSSDLCKVKALGRVEKAIMSPIPGTTLNLLKFPVMRPDPSRIYQRMTRIHGDEQVFRKREQERLQMLSQTKDRRHALVSGIVGQTFTPDKLLPLRHVGFDIDGDGAAAPKVTLPMRLNPEHPHFADGRWCYDTPGTICKDQVINLLTQEEITKVMPELQIRPRCFGFKNGTSIFLGGLGRLDLLGGPFKFRPMLIVVFCSDDLPIHMVRTTDADMFYERAMRTGLLGVPCGDASRLEEFPPLEGQTFEVDGVAHFEATSDIVFSSAGWISCVPPMHKICTVKAWTPGGRGIYVRDPPFLPFAHLLRGERIGGTPAYRPNKVFAPN